eukprot:TRINITY_DN196_c0_g2_i2.p1 TRINITY_DN196_c0_g2~~TRINITY_DN196_c0_g2_i2.p1  ORF type:complete len:224 (-),score=91.94 TRINITY_DN196_c0_g2_i2:112-783(-)
MSDGFEDFATPPASPSPSLLGDEAAPAPDSASASLFDGDEGTATEAAPSPSPSPSLLGGGEGADSPSGSLFDSMTAVTPSPSASPSLLSMEATASPVASAPTPSPTPFSGANADLTEFPEYAAWLQDHQALLDKKSQSAGARKAQAEEEARELLNKLASERAALIARTVEKNRLEQETAVLENERVLTEGEDWARVTALLNVNHKDTGKDRSRLREILIQLKH